MDTIQNVSVVSPIAQGVNSLIDSRTALVGAAKKTGQVVKVYAMALCSAFDLTDNQGQVTTKWFDLKGALKKGVNAEREAFVAAMTNEGFGKPTIDVYWQRVKEASGYITAGNRVKGAMNVDDKTKAELQTMINRIFKAEEDGVSCYASEHKATLMDIFADLGGDIDKLG
jgi:hypothetical protein